jgi:hypothetical protein
MNSGLIKSIKSSLKIGFLRYGHSYNYKYILRNDNLDTIKF